MEASLHGEDIFAAKLTENQLSGMSFYGRNRKVRNVSVRKFIGVRNF